jgi:hypothetical protein
MNLRVLGSTKTIISGFHATDVIIMEQPWRKIQSMRQCQIWGIMSMRRGGLDEAIVNNVEGCSDAEVIPH